MSAPRSKFGCLRWRIEIGRTFKLSVPIMFGMIGQMALGIADTAMVGRVGVIPLAASALVNAIAHVPLLAGIGLLISISIRTAHAYGANQAEEAAECLRHGLLLAVGCGAMVGLSMTWLDSQLHHLGQPEPVVAAAHTYMLLYGWSLAPVMLSHSVKQFCEALNDPWPPMLILIGGVALNIFLNWILIYGNLGAPRLALEGAGIATVIARLAMAIASLLYVVSARRLNRFQPPTWWHNWSWARLTSLARLGLPIALQHVMEVGAFVGSGLMMGWIGAEAIAAHQIAINCASATFIIALSIAMAVSIRVGHAWGARLPLRIRRITGGGLVMALGFMSICAVIFFLEGRTLAGWFIESDRVVSIATGLLIVACFFQIADGTQVVMLSALRGMGDVRLPTIIAGFAYWLITLPLGYLLAFRLNLGPKGIWIGLAAGLSIAAALFAGRFLVRTRPLNC